MDFTQNVSIGHLRTRGHPDVEPVPGFGPRGGLMRHKGATAPGLASRPGHLVAPRSLEQRITGAPARGLTLQAAEPMEIWIGGR